MESRTRQWALLFIGWSIAGVVQALFRSALARTPGEAVLDLLRYDLPLAWTWAVLTPAIGRATEYIERSARSVPSTLLAHLPVVIAALAVHTAIRRALVVAAGHSLAVPFHLTLLYYLDLTLLSYLAAVWAARAMRAHPLLVQREQQTERLQRQLAAAQLAYLELQLRPHFLFNALGTVVELAHRAPAAATRMLRNVIALLRTAVADRARGVVPLREELAMLQPYLDIQRVRFEDWLVLEEDIEAGAEDIAIPAFTLQPLVENAVHHGLTRRSERGRIVIRARRAGDRLRVSVIDNGVGLSGSAWNGGAGLGLTNLRARLDAVYGGAASLELGSEPGAGAAVHLDIPVSACTDAAPDARGDADDRADGTDRTIERDEHPAMRWARRRPAAAAMLVWAIVAALRIQHSFVYLLIRQRFTPDEFRAAVRFDAAVAVLWLAATPGMLWLVRRVPLRRDGLAVRLAVHTLAACVIALALTAGSRFLASDARFPLGSPAFSQVYAWNASVYAVVLLLAHLQAVQRWLRERALSAERLRKELQEARLRRAMVELRPAILLQALERVADRIGAHPREAEEALAAIADFLRVSLESARERHVPLRTESAAVEAYARVIALGAAPALRLQLNVPLRLLDAMVPTGVLRAALDAVMGDAPSDGFDVYVDVGGGETTVEIEAVARAPRRAVAAAPGDRRLAEYQAQGLLDVLAEDADGVRLRMGA